MKRIFAVVAVLLLLLSAVGCSPNEIDPSVPAEEESQVRELDRYLFTEDDRQYLILPVSQAHIRLSSSLLPYLDQIDPALLTSAEEKITAEAAAHSQQAYFSISLKEERLYLYGEFIVYYPGATEKGCGLDHDHFCLREPISDP